MPAIQSDPHAHVYDGVKLFVERAERASGGFKLNRENLPGVVQACQLVDGLPLAVELAYEHVLLDVPNTFLDGGPTPYLDEFRESEQFNDAQVAWRHDKTLANVTNFSLEAGP